MNLKETRVQKPIEERECCHQNKLHLWQPLWEVDMITFKNRSKWFVIAIGNISKSMFMKFNSVICGTKFEENQTGISNYSTTIVCVSLTFHQYIFQKFLWSCTRVHYSGFGVAILPSKDINTMVLSKCWSHFHFCFATTQIHNSCSNLSAQVAQPKIVFAIWPTKEFKMPSVQFGNSRTKGCV